MKIKEFQNIIDRIRGKKNTQSSKFKYKLKTLIKNSVKYSYPDVKHEFIPDFSLPIQVEKSVYKNYIEYKKALKTIQQKFDVKGLEQTYSLLNDEYSKELYLMLIIYWLFDDVKIRLPLYYAEYFNKLTQYDYLFSDDTKITVTNGDLHKYNLKPLNYDLELIYGNRLAFQIMMIEEQYRYKNIIEVEPNDIVIDGGGCYGETALYFIDKMDGKGKVYSFEFMPQNLEIFDKNLELNPQYKNKIEIVKHPMSRTSEEKLYSVYQASASYVTDKPTEGCINLTSLSIDDFVNKYNIEKVDFLKLDIEGFEFDTLKGAEKTIKAYKPKLAICIYHKVEDLWQIPLYLKEIVPEYQFYIDHFTINTEETVLFAKAGRG